MFHSTSSRSSLGHSQPQPTRSHSHSSSHPHSHSHSSSQSRPKHHHSISQQPPPQLQQQQSQRAAFNASRPRPDYPVTHEELWRVFNEVDADLSGAISVMELQRALKNGTLLAILGYTENQLKTGNPTEDWQPFDLDTVKMLMNYFDKDQNGSITFNEFAGLFKYIYEWQQVFKFFDRDNSHTIDGGELKAALDSFGYPLSSSVVRLVQRKYASLPDMPYGPQPGITFDRFVRACVAIKWLSDSFVSRDADRDGLITVNYEQFMRIFFESP